MSLWGLWVGLPAFLCPSTPRIENGVHDDRLFLQGKAKWYDLSDGLGQIKLSAKFTSSSKVCLFEKKWRRKVELGAEILRPCALRLSDIHAHS